jgi:hypothetical protein
MNAAVFRLNKLLDSFDRKFVETANVSFFAIIYQNIQQSEEERLETIKNKLGMAVFSLIALLGLLLKLQSEIFGAMISKFYSQMPLIMETVNEQSDLDTYILKNMTGTERTTRFAFRSYFADDRIVGGNTIVFVKVSHQEANDIKGARKSLLPSVMSSDDLEFKMHQMEDLKKLVAKQSANLSEMKSSSSISSNHRISESLLKVVKPLGSLGTRSRSQSVRTVDSVMFRESTASRLTPIPSTKSPLNSPNMTQIVKSRTTDGSNHISLGGEYPRESLSVRLGISEAPSSSSKVQLISPEKIQNTLDGEIYRESGGNFLDDIISNFLASLADEDSTNSDTTGASLARSLPPKQVLPNPPEFNSEEVLGNMS